MTEHRWSGWPGAWCLDCGCEDPREIALADGRCNHDGIAILTPEEAASLECPEPNSNRHNPYAKGAIEDPKQEPASNILEHKLNLILAQLRTLALEISHVKAIVEAVRDTQKKD